MRKLLGLAFFLALAGVGGWYWYQQLHAGPRWQFRTANVEQRPFMAAVNASGTLVPVETIDVGSEIAGRIESFGFDPRYQKDRDDLLLLDMALGQALTQGGPRLLLAGLLPVRFIDKRSPVEKDTVLAQIEPRLFEIRFKKAQADLDKAKADLELAEAKQAKASEDWKRAQDLHRTKALADAEYDRYKGLYEEAVAHAKQCDAAIAQQLPPLEEAQYNLDKTVIRSKVKGVIVERRVNIGQTVVASLNAPSLFLLATDITQLKIIASVNEVDIGYIHPGQEVRFTLEGMPHEEFLGRVPEDQPTFNVNFTQNVVTYPVQVYVDNSVMKLYPYRTANVRFVQTRKSNALVVPNGALRWKPTPSQVVAKERAKYQQSLKKRRTSEQEKVEAVERTVWVEDEGQVRPVPIRIGLSDGTATEVLGGALKEGDEVVTGDESRSDGGSGSNPFAPSPGSKKNFQ